MSTEFDATKLAAQFAQQNAEKFVGLAVTGVKGVATQVRARLNRTYRTYLERLLERYGRGKSFFVRSEPVSLYEFFVPLDLATQARRLSAPSILDVIQVSPFAIIAGTGGCGKSMMMRHLLVSCIEAKEKTPIYLELRQLNHATHTVAEALLQTVQSFGLSVDAAFLEAAMEAGQLAILLDGFDEIEQSIRQGIAAEIRLLAQRYPNIWIVMSSRPDAELQGWEVFTLYTVAPLTVERAEELVQKVPFDEQLKDRFILDMRNTLFRAHQSFLSNPLLLSIMLLTYGDVAHIPHKLSTFYSQAYEALFYRHDALKSGYQRERRSQLDIQDFSRAFAAFSLLSYDRREFSFTLERALETVAEGRSIAMVDFDDQAFLNDAVQAICLLLEEGLEIRFAHRSFQEYFVARFIQMSPPEIKAKLVERFATNVLSDQVIWLLWELDPYIVEKYYLLPRLTEIRELCGIVGQDIGLTHLHRFLSGMAQAFFLRGDGSVDAMTKDSDLLGAARFVQHRYGSLRIQDEVLHENESVRQAFDSEYGSVPSVVLHKVEVNGPFLQAIAATPTIFGIQLLGLLMQTEEEILARHSVNQDSLRMILADNAMQHAPSGKRLRFLPPPHPPA
jgi:hypothetical protein